MKKFLSVFLFLFSVAATVPSCLAGSPIADQAFTVSLNGAQEVPPSGSSGTGSGTVFFDSDTTTVTLSVSYSGLSFPSTVAHIHLGAPGVPGGVIVDLASLTTFGGTSGTFIGTLPFPPANIPDLFAGNTYLNVHSTAFAGGEIRGQILAVPEPTTALLVGLSLAGLGLKLRRRSA